MALTCTRCGNNQLVATEPGIFRCEARLQVGLIPQGNLPPVPAFESCGTIVRTGVGLSTCAFCGRLCIGYCDDCGRPLCHIHGSSGREFLCADDEDSRGVRAAEAEHAAAEREARRRAEYEESDEFRQERAIAAADERRDAKVHSLNAEVQRERRQSSRTFAVLLLFPGTFPCLAAILSSIGSDVPKPLLLISIFVVPATVLFVVPRIVRETRRGARIRAMEEQIADLARSKGRVD